MNTSPITTWNHPATLSVTSSASDWTRCYELWNRLHVATVGRYGSQVGQLLLHQHPGTAQTPFPQTMPSAPAR